MTHTQKQLTPRALLATLPQPPQIHGATTALDMPLDAICDDSRRACSTSLFVCIRGAVSDGHRYIHAAYAQGCRVFLMQELPDKPLPPDAAVCLSDDTHRDLALLCTAFYGNPARRMRVVGITGTKGKTTVALMCYHILKKQGRAVGYIGTNGVRYGEVQKATRNTTPGAPELQKYLFEMQNAGIDTVLLEVSSQSLWQKRVEGIPFAVCALTNLYPDHIGAPEHPSMEHYAACKRRLLTDFGAPVIIGNADATDSLPLLQGATGKLVLCGTGHGVDMRAESISEQKRGALPITRFICRDKKSGEGVSVSLPLPGVYNVQNALFALAIARALDVPLAQAAEALGDVCIPGRFECIEVKGALVVIDYAHNGAALRAVLTALRAMKPSRLLCLVGSVGGRTQCRRAELGSAADELADFTYLTADDPDGESVEDICRDMAAAFRPRFLPNYTVLPDRAEAIRTALDELSDGDILLLAGKGDERAIRIGGRDITHRDRDVVEAYIAKKMIEV